MTAGLHYNYAHARRLEGSLSGPRGLGVWMLTYNRTQFGWGRVSEQAYPADGSISCPQVHSEPTGSLTGSIAARCQSPDGGRLARSGSVVRGLDARLMHILPSSVDGS